jgi:hypothetical protein
MLARAAAGASPGRDPAAARQAIAAIGAQGLGFHTDWHSRHPTVSEYCTGAGWDGGIRRVEEAEAPGMASLRDVFPGRPVVCYGQPGGDWAPQVCPVLRRWGIPLYMDEAEHVGLDEQPFYYGGVLHVLRLRQFCVHRRAIHPPREGPEAALADLDRIVAALRARGGGLGQCWWHPNEWYTDQWWDQLNFGRGANRVPAGPETVYHVPEMLPDAEREARFAALGAFLDGVVRRGDVRVCAADEIVTGYPDRARGRAFSQGELLRVAEAAAESISHQRHGEIALSAAEALFLLASALAAPAPPPSVVLEASPDGPAARVAPELPASASLEEVRVAAAALVCAVRRTGRLPDALPLAGGTADPASLAAACARAYPLACGRGAGAVELRSARLTAEDAVRGEGVWSWAIFAPGFHPQDLVELGRLQAWTLKPAVPAA